MTAPTWEQVHGGDTVYAADGRKWTITARDAEREWVHEGREARFVLALDGREVEFWTMLDHPAMVAERADHSAEAHVAQALIDGGIRFKVLEERYVTTVEPMAAQPPKRPVKRDQWGRYLLPDPRTGKEKAWTRATTLARVLADEYNLGQWAERMVAKGMAARPDLVAGAAAAPLEDKKTLQGIAKQAKEAAGSTQAANLGTALHSFTERADGGETIDQLGAPANLHADLVAYQQRMREAGFTIVPELIERIVVCPELGVAGTFDRVVRKADGTLSVLDLKTGKDLSYGWMEIAIQQAIYANATHYYEPDGERLVEIPSGVLDRKRAYILHLPVGRASAQLYTVDIETGWRLAQIAADVKTSRSKAKELAELIEAPTEDADAVYKRITHAQSQQELAAIWEDAHPRGQWTAAVNTYAQARLRQLTGGAV
ncbi:PD-(D/E)XK nuclease family protein [Amycolatopsis jiangsuensis]|uniref:PD-(D/E)XK endonuclease-like domain-containing protein n=1 Tax=Amycolatopsis jiangsuensis TaxID=1181879 RepID=A0A840J708_9PSEU|nr:PD-(D/E)XK nuclease family protein [Amycolatopsis jiangsuensis]MBB4689800.1 hypothetical protein [Amycolatopsis jiangsuensis]